MPPEQIANPMADLEGGAPGARPPNFFPNTIFFITILYKEGGF